MKGVMIMLEEGMIVYFLVNGFTMQGKVVNLTRLDGHDTFQIEGYGGCAGPHILDSLQLHHTIFLSEEEANQYRDQEQMYLDGYC